MPAQERRDKQKIVTRDETFESLPVSRLLGFAFSTAQLKKKGKTKTLSGTTRGTRQASKAQPPRTYLFITKKTKKDRGCSSHN